MFKDVCIRMFITALFVVVKTENNLTDKIGSRLVNGIPCSHLKFFHGYIIFVQRTV